MRPSQALAEVVRALNRGMRSMGYYDPTHPVFEAARREAYERLQSLWDGQGAVTLGGAGRHLVIDVDGGVLEDEPARAFAARMFEASVVALRLHAEAGPADLGRVLEALAERPERLRAAGGVRSLLTGWGVTGVEVFEVDFGALFAGEVADLGPLVGQDPVAELALRGVLRFREAGEEAAPGAVGVSFERLDDPDSLGGFLDGLMDDAGPQVVEGAAGFLTADDFADQAAQGYLRGQIAASAKGASEQTLADSANVLAGALVRLSPEARFALLRKLAGADEAASPEQEAASARLGERIDDDLIRGAVAAALLEHPHDPDVVRAVGNVIRRLRPVEARRQALLGALDDGTSSAGRPLDGVVWQQIRARAEQEPGLGMLEMALTEHREVLQEALTARLRFGPAYPGQDVVHAAAPAVVEHWSVRALAALLGDPGRLGSEVVDHAQAQAVLLERQGASDEAQVVLQALVRRVSTEGLEGPAARALRACLATEHGERWARRLIEASPPRGVGSGEVLLVALDHVVEAPARAQLIERLSGLGPEALWDLVAQHLPAAEPRRLVVLLDAAYAVAPKLGLKIAKVALRSAEPRVKDGVLRRLAGHPQREEVAVLACVAGWKGDRRARALLGGLEPDAIHRHQLTAVGALGLCHSPLAVRPLLDLVTRGRLFSDTAAESLRVAAVQALSTNGTAPAKAALEQASQHNRRAVRDLVARVLGGRS